MSRKSTYPVLFFLGVMVVVFSLTSCGKLNPNYLQANRYFTAANHHFTEQKFRIAIEEYERALSYNPNLIQAYRFLGESYKSLYKPGVEDGRNTEIAANALNALNKALEIDPNNKQIIHSLGDMYDKMRNFEEAEKLFLMIIKDMF